MVLIQALIDAMNNLPRIYQEILNSNYFQGGWSEEPEFSEKEYQQYVGWLNGSEELPKNMKGLKKSTLIGANKVFEVLTLLSISAGFRHGKSEGNIGLKISDDSSLIVDYIGDPDDYSYKYLYIKNPRKGIIGLRAASVYEFLGLFALNNRQTQVIRTTKSRLLEILGKFSRLNNDVNRRILRLELSSPFDSAVSLEVKNYKR